MYRKPLLSIEDAMPLIGQVVRLEYSPYDNRGHRDWVGVVTKVNGGYDGRAIEFTRAHGDKDDLTWFSGTNVVFATTLDDFIPPEREAPFVDVLWRDRATLQISPPSP